MNFTSPVFKFMLASPVGPAPIFRGPYVALDFCAGRDVLGGLFLAADAEVRELLVGIDGDVTDCTPLDRNCSADLLVDGRGLHFAGRAVRKYFGQINANDLRGFSRSVGLRAGRRNRGASCAGCSGCVSQQPAGVAQEIQVHRVIREAEHPRVAALGDLNDVTGFFVDRHGLSLDAIRAEHHPLAVGGPLVMGRIDLGISGRRAGQKRERHSGDRIGHNFLFGGKPPADLSGGRHCKETGENQRSGGERTE